MNGSNGRKGDAPNWDTLEGELIELKGKATNPFDTPTQCLQELENFNTKLSTLDNLAKTSSFDTHTAVRNKQKIAGWKKFYVEQKATLKKALQKSSEQIMAETDRTMAQTERNRQSIKRIDDRRQQVLDEKLNEGLTDSPEKSRRNKRREATPPPQRRRASDKRDDYDAKLENAKRKVEEVKSVAARGMKKTVENDGLEAEDKAEQLAAIELRTRSQFEKKQTPKPKPATVSLGNIWCGWCCPGSRRKPEAPEQDSSGPKYQRLPDL